MADQAMMSRNGKLSKFEEYLNSEIHLDRIADMHSGAVAEERLASIEAPSSSYADFMFTIIVMAIEGDAGIPCQRCQTCFGDGFKKYGS